MATNTTQNILEELRTGYIAALPGKIEDIESSVLGLESEGYHGEAFATLYRNVHSLKGSGGTYGFNIVTAVCHQLEDNLDDLSKHTKTQESEINTLLVYVDLLKELQQTLIRPTNDYNRIEQSLAQLKQKRLQNNISGLIVEPSATNIALLKNTLEELQVSLSIETDGIVALNRLVHEKFDFLITSNEIANLNGLALIAATKLSSRVNKKIKTALVTSNKPQNTCGEVFPDEVILKNSSLMGNLHLFVENLQKP